MKLSDFTRALKANPDLSLQFVFDDGETIPAEFHITEVGHVVKKFIDCGGTVRTTEACLLQAWVADEDKDHRLSPGKLASIIGLAKKVLPAGDLDVEVEYEGCVLSQYTVERFEVKDGALRFFVVDKHTDCLAREACGLDGCGCAPAGSSKCC